MHKINIAYPSHKINIAYYTHKVLKQLRKKIIKNVACVEIIGSQKFTFCYIIVYTHVAVTRSVAH